MNIDLNSTQRKFLFFSPYLNKYCKSNIIVTFNVFGKIEFLTIKQNLKKILESEPVLRSHFSVKSKRLVYSGNIKLFSLRYVDNEIKNTHLQILEKKSYKLNHKYHFTILYTFDVKTNNTKISISISHNICDGVALIFLFHSLLDFNQSRVNSKKIKLDYDIDNKYNLKPRVDGFKEGGEIVNHFISIPNIAYNGEINFNINKLVSIIVFSLYESSKEYLKFFVVKEIFKYIGFFNINNEIDFYVYDLTENVYTEGDVALLRKQAKEKHFPYWDFVNEINEKLYSGFYGVANIEVNYRARFNGLNRFEKYYYDIVFEDESIIIPEADISLIVDKVDKDYI